MQCILCSTENALRPWSVARAIVYLALSLPYKPSIRFWRTASPSGRKGFLLILPSYLNKTSYDAYCHTAGYRSYSDKKVYRLGKVKGSRDGVRNTHEF